MAKQQAETTTERIVEAFPAIRTEAIDAAAGVIRGVKLLGLHSRNGRTYPADVARAAVGLYEGSKVNVNHPAGSDPGAPRIYEDRLGVIRGANFRSGHEGGVYGDFRFNPKHRLAEQLIWDATHAPENLGFSHNAVLRLAPGQTIVQRHS